MFLCLCLCHKPGVIAKQVKDELFNSVTETKPGETIAAATKEKNCCLLANVSAQTLPLKDSCHASDGFAAEQLAPCIRPGTNIMRLSGGTTNLLLLGAKQMKKGRHMHFNKE